MEKDGTVRWELIRNKLLQWFARSGRTFLWRTTRDPYVILIAEILLKRTGAPVVDRFLPGFLQTFPTAASLSETPTEVLEQALSPVGLTRQRAHQFRALGEALTARFGAKIPCSKDELISLPGIGEYTAAAVLCFAYGQPQALVDTNIARIITRLAGIVPSRYEARRSPEIWEAAQALVGTDADEARHVNWALLDLGASICKVRDPRCQECPLPALCQFSITHRDPL